MGQRYQGRIVRWLGAFAGRHIDLSDLLDKEITRSDREVAATLEGIHQEVSWWKETEVESRCLGRIDSIDLLELINKYGLEGPENGRWVGRKTLSNTSIQEVLLTMISGELTYLTVTRYDFVTNSEVMMSNIQRPKVGLWLSDSSVTKYFVTDVWSVKDDRHPGRLRPTHRAATCNADHGHAELFCMPSNGWIKGIITREHPSRLDAEVREAVLSAAERHGLSVFYLTKKGWKKV